MRDRAMQNLIVVLSCIWQCPICDAAHMSPITHFFIRWAVANSVPTLTKRDRAMITWASVVPDVDGLGIIAERLTQNSAHPLNWWSDYHHVLGHNLGFAMAIPALAAVFARQRIKAMLLVFFS